MDANPNATLPTVADTHVPVGSQVTVTIGRNVGDRPMFAFEWNDFKRCLADLLGDVVAPTLTFGPFKGTGEWEGVAEESSVLIVITGRAVDPARLSGRLVHLARAFNQDAIAWSYGPNLLATR
jgi:hypothetical protein